jgi:FAD synthase
MTQGIYAARATVGEEHYAGMLWYAPDALLGRAVSFDFYPFDTIGFYVSGGSPITVEVVHAIREPKSFAIPEQLVQQLQDDIARARTILKI